MAQPPQNYCPFGCGVADLDELCYCRHLVGFTNEPKQGAKVERTVPQVSLEGHLTGRMKTVRLKPERVKARDVLVNPEKVARENNAEIHGHAWVSWRVYRKDHHNGLKPPIALAEQAEQEEEPLEAPAA